MVHFWGAYKDHFQAFGTTKIENVLRFVRLLGENRVFERDKIPQMLCFVVFGHQEPFNMINVKTRQPPKICTVSGFKRQFDKWHLIRARTQNPENRNIGKTKQSSLFSGFLG